MAEWRRLLADCGTCLPGPQKLPSCESVREDATSLYNARPSQENAQLRDHSEQLCAAALQAQTAVTDRHQAVGMWAELASHRYINRQSVSPPALDGTSLTDDIQGDSILK